MMSRSLALLICGVSQAVVGPSVAMSIAR